MPTLKNLTPHTVILVDANNETIREYPSVGNARAASIATPVGEVDGIPVNATVFGEVQGLPETDNPDARELKDHETIYIVSMVVAQAAKNRNDIVAPDTGPTAYRVADGPRKGQIIGVRGFVQY